MIPMISLMDLTIERAFMDLTIDRDAKFDITVFDQFHCIWILCGYHLGFCDYILKQVCQHVFYAERVLSNSWYMMVSVFFFLRIKGL